MSPVRPTAVCTLSRSSLPDRTRCRFLAMWPIHKSRIPWSWNCRVFVSCVFWRRGQGLILAPSLMWGTQCVDTTPFSVVFVLTQGCDGYHVAKLGAPPKFCTQVYFCNQHTRGDDFCSRWCHSHRSRLPAMSKTRPQEAPFFFVPQ